MRRYVIQLKINELRKQLPKMKIQKSILPPDCDSQLNAVYRDIVRFCSLNASSPPVNFEKKSKVYLNKNKLKNNNLINCCVWH